MIFPRVEDIREVTAALMYRQHGGNGFGFSYSDIQDLTWDEALWYVERQSELRKEEAAAIKRAHGSH